ncbi:CreA family protein [Daeguia caeni]|uniref:CreA family protein n=1 Tax=Daeguia caeni TaxID=439612 RepID=A0ABV9H7T3_9HYPH
MKKLLGASAFLALSVMSAMAEEVGKVPVDWFGNDIVIDAVHDPKVKGVTCHLASFSRGIIDRLQKGNWFEDPSNASISCEQTGPIVIGDIKLGKGGERVFSERTSLIWKKLVITRIYDQTNNTLLYLAHASQVQDGSAKTSLSTVPLFRGDVTWEKGPPQ